MKISNKNTSLLIKNHPSINVKTTTPLTPLMEKKTFKAKAKKQ